MDANLCMRSRVQRIVGFFVVRYFGVLLQLRSSRQQCCPRSVETGRDGHEMLNLETSDRDDETFVTSRDVKVH